MKNDSPLRFYIRILLVAIFIAILGLGPTPHAAGKFLVDAYQSAVNGEFLNAARNLAGVAQYYPWQADFNLQAARYAIRAGDAKMTIQYLQRPEISSQLTPDDLILLGDAYAQSGDSSSAEAVWKGIIAKGDSAQACQRLADLYLQRKDYASALSYSQKQLKLNPSDIHLYYQIGLLYAATDPVLALPFLAQAAEIDPVNGSQAQAIHDKIRTASLFDDPPYTLLISGRQLASINEWGYALEAFQRAVAMKPDYTDAWAFLGEAQQQINPQGSGSSGDFGLSELKQALRLDSSSILANTFMAMYWERHEDYPQAQHYLEQAITASPDDPYLFTELGNILSKAGDLPSAQSAYEKAIQIDPQNPLFYRLLAVYAVENQIQIRELALPAIRQALIIDPSDSTSLDVMAQVMLILQDYHSAERFSLDALQSDPKYAPAYLHLGMAYVYLGESDSAYKWLSLAETVDPKSWVTAQARRLLDYYFPK